MYRGCVAALVCACVVTAGAASARAQDDEAGYDVERVAFSHRHQVELHLQGGIGYRGIFPYNDEYCGDLKDGGGNKADCLGKSPVALDLGAGYGLTARLEAFVELRLGLERDFGTAPGLSGPRPLGLAPGLKLFIADIGATMFFSTLQLPIDFTGYDQADKADIGVRNVNGLQLDLHRTFGLYVYFGEEASWRRWLSFEVDAGLGAQVRFP